jgi:predicted transcriptional regulator
MKNKTILAPLQKKGDNIEKALESGPLEILFSGNATAKILDFLTAFQEWDYSESDIAKNSGISLRTIQREIHKLKQYKLVTQTRRVGKAKMYKLDKSHTTGSLIEKLALLLTKIDVQDILPADARDAKKV